MNGSTWVLKEEQELARWSSGEGCLGGGGRGARAGPQRACRACLGFVHLEPVAGPWRKLREILWAGSWGQVSWVYLGGAGTLQEILWCWVYIWGNSAGSRVQILSESRHLSWHTTGLDLDSRFSWHALDLGQQFPSLDRWGEGRKKPGVRKQLWLRVKLWQCWDCSSGKMCTLQAEHFCGCWYFQPWQ